MKKVLPVALAVALASGTAVAGGDMSFDKLDADKSGAIERQEAQKHQELGSQWSQLDVNSDGKLSKTEFAAVEAGAQASSKSSSGAGQMSFDKLDADKSGSIERQELQKHQELSGQFSELDEDRDGKLSQSEFAAVEAGAQAGSKSSGSHSKSGTSGDLSFTKLDADKSGSIERQELQKHPELSGQFNRVDENGDGKLSSTEFAELQMASTSSTSRSTGTSGSQTGSSSRSQSDTTSGMGGRSSGSETSGSGTSGSGTSSSGTSSSGTSGSFERSSEDEKQY